MLLFAAQIKVRRGIIFFIRRQSEGNFDHGKRKTHGGKERERERERERGRERGVGFSWRVSRVTAAEKPLS